jgi:hypothetical protein
MIGRMIVVAESATEMYKNWAKLHKCGEGDDDASSIADTIASVCCCEKLEPLAAAVAEEVEEVVAAPVVSTAAR